MAPKPSKCQRALSCVYQVSPLSSPREQATSIQGAPPRLWEQRLWLGSGVQPVPRPESCAHPQSWEWSLWGRSGSPKEIGVRLSEVEITCWTTQTSRRPHRLPWGAQLHMTYNPLLCHGLDPGAQRGSEVEPPYWGGRVGCRPQLGVMSTRSWNLF